jgi:molecular chaperone GrpE
MIRNLGMGEQDNEQVDQTLERLTEVGELPASGQGQAPSVEALEAECERLTRQNAELTDQLLRRRADLENLRKRVERERQEVQVRAAMDAAASALPVLDGLERALAGDQSAASEFHAGVELIARQLRETLIKSGLEPIEALGRKFDPHIHEAVERVETTEHEDQTVVEEWQRGYRFRGRLLRPAMVKVAVRPESR